MRLRASIATRLGNECKRPHVATNHYYDCVVEPGRASAARHVKLGIDICEEGLVSSGAWQSLGVVSNGT